MKCNIPIMDYFANFFLDLNVFNWIGCALTWSHLRPGLF